MLKGTPEGEKTKVMILHEVLDLTLNKWSFSNVYNFREQFIASRNYSKPISRK